MISTRRYNRSYSNRLREKCSRAGKESQRVQSLKRQALSEQGWEPFEDIVARYKRDRKGSHYATWERKGVAMELRHSLNGRSDQYDVTEIRDSKWGGGCEPTVTRHYNLSIPKVLKLFTK